MNYCRLWLFALLVFTGCAPYGLPRSGEKIYRNVVFASPGGQRLHMDLYVPKTKQPAPVVVWIFGGSWKFGSKGFHVNLRDLPQSGIALAAIQYRLSGTAKYPAQLNDCQAAVDWLKKNGAQFGIDSSRIGLSGESAGGHLAALLGTIDGTPAIRAVCVLYPPTDLVALGRQYSSADRPSDIEKLLGGPIEEKLALAKQASPVQHVSSSSPPFLIFHGKKDQLVPISHSQDLHDRLTRAGVSSRLVVNPDEGHWYLLNEEELEAAIDFFQTHLQESGKLAH